MTKVRCDDCGEGLSQTAIRQIAMDDFDPEFSLGEKMFQFSQFWLAGQDEGAHFCKVIDAL